jgi:hypothetical protein
MSSTTVNSATTAAYSSPFTSTAAAQAVSNDLTSSAGAASVAASTATVIPSSTVTLSAAGVGLLESLGQSAVDVAEGGTRAATDAVDLPVDLATDLVSGFAGAIESLGKATVDLGSGDLGLMATDAGAAVHSLVAMPEAILSNTVPDVKSFATDAATFGSGLLGLATLGAV